MRGVNNVWTSQLKSHLVFLHRGGRLRVSEQEARFAFVEALCQGPLHYSVETPTRKRYGFSSDRKRAAQTDLTVRDEKMEPLCNVEFKSKGVSRGADARASIAKDMEKLVREPVPGLWFHLLEGVNRNTIRQLLATLANKAQRDFDDIESPSLAVHICVLRHGFSIQKHFPIPLYKEEDFDIDLRVNRTELLGIMDCNGWIIRRTI